MGVEKINSGLVEKNKEVIGLNEKKEVSSRTSEKLKEMKGNINFSREQISSFEETLKKRFSIDNNFCKLLEGLSVDKRELESFIENFNNGKFDRYYTSKGEIKDLTSVQESQIKDFFNRINNISENNIEINKLKEEFSKITGLDNIMGFLGSSYISKRSYYSRNFNSRVSNDVYQIN